MPPGVCKLCRQEKDLQDSHLIPAAIIRRLREPSLDNPNPIIVTGKVAVQSPRPIKDYVLCNVCEGLFSKKGEMWVIGNMARDDKFLLLDALEKSKPIAADNEIAVYAGAQIPEIDVDKLVYFALSVFWRSAVHKWRGFSGPIPSIELGPYQEPIRTFLLGNGPFPVHMVLLVSVWPTRNAYQGTYTPRRGRETRFHTFTFYIPGIEFSLCVGRGIPSEARKMCAYPSPHRLIFSGNATVRNTVKSLHNLLESSRNAKGLNRTLQKIAAMRTR
jgi:hypothetical protein